MSRWIFQGVETMRRLQMFAVQACQSGTPVSADHHDKHLRCFICFVVGTRKPTLDVVPFIAS